MPAMKFSLRHCVSRGNCEDQEKTNIVYSNLRSDVLALRMTLVVFLTERNLTKHYRGSPVRIQYESLINWPTKANVTLLRVVSGRQFDRSTVMGFPIF
jgi:hypothetical protein